MRMFPKMLVANCVLEEWQSFFACVSSVDIFNIGELHCLVRHITKITSIL